MTDRPDDDAQATVEYAIRYCLTRYSYAFFDGLSLAEKHWSTLADSTRRDVLQGIAHRLSESWMTSGTAFYSRPCIREAYEKQES